MAAATSFFNLLSLRRPLVSLIGTPGTKRARNKMVGSMQDFLLAYDASCGPCSRFKGLVEFLDARRRIAFVSLEEADKSGALEGVPPSLRYRSFHLLRPREGRVDGGGVRSGSDALLPLLRLLPGGDLAARFVEAAPGAEGAVSFAYSALSRLHDTGSCSPTPSSG
jgi:predicted DCC family thiol-disulfide oxidoreductase YuxK